MACFDHIVLTAANSAQARGYQAQLDWRKQNRILDPETRVYVIPDPRGRRVGSLGATLHALRKLAESLLSSKQDHAKDSLEQLFKGKRILICHSGGDSRRTPAYAAHGKVFTPLPTTLSQGQPAALFDLLLNNLGKLPSPSNGHVLIAVGDVLLTFDPSAISFSRKNGIVGVAYPGPISRGSLHGVYVTRTGATKAGCMRVKDFLQKPTEEIARHHHAIDPVGRVMVDTGLLSLDPGTAARLLTCSGASWQNGRMTVGPGLLRDLAMGRCPPMDLYEELAMALIPSNTLDQYLAAQANRIHSATHRARLTRFYHAIHDIPFFVNILPYCDFFHIGSSRDLLTNIATRTRTADDYQFTNFNGSMIAAGAGIEGSFVFNSLIETPRVQLAHSMVEAVHTNRPVELQGHNILVGIPPDHNVAIRLRPNLGLVCLPIGKNQWAAVLYGLDDDFKTSRDQRKKCLFLNKPIDEWLNRHNIAPSSVWRQGQCQDLWEARLWLVGTLSAVLRGVLWMQSDRKNPGIHEWIHSRRYSMAQLVPLVNHARLIAHMQEIHRLVGLKTLAKGLLTDTRLSAAKVCEQVRSPAEAKTAWSQIASAIQRRPDPLFKARALRLASLLARQYPPFPRMLRSLGCSDLNALATAPFQAIAQAVAVSVDLPDGPGPAAILHDQVVWVTTPARMDFAGGWSDTPPISIEMGGAVVNAAVTLNGQYPVQVMAKLNEERIIRLSSIDLGEREEIHSTTQLLDHTNPHHWAALPKAAIVLAGIGPGIARASLKRWLDAIGGGIDMTIFSALPKGSGMGTSSILGAAVLACLRRVLGLSCSFDKITALTSVLEQRMSTGGGWQDQVGGIIPGIKLITTNPGPAQSISLKWTVFNMAPDSELRSRLLLYYTGHKRMARDILHHVVGRYLARDPEILRIIKALKESALEMKASLDAQDIEAFAGGLNNYWSLKKEMDPDATNRKIETILHDIQQWTSGRVLPGAGGGGFILIVARDASAARSIRRRLTSNPPNRQARFFDFDIDSQGLKVTVL